MIEQSEGQKYRVLLFGLGAIGSKHFKVINDHPCFALAATIETNAERAILSEHYGIPSFSSLEEATELDFDCAIIATPTNTHVSIIEALLKRGKPFLVEKPFAFNFNEALRIKALVERQNIPCAVGYSERCNPLIWHLKQRLFHSDYGDLQSIKINRTSVMNALNATNSNNVIFDLAVHDFEFLKSIFGTITIESGFTSFVRGSESIGRADLSLRNCKCSDISLYTEWLIEPAERVRMYSFYYDTACIEVNFLTKTLSVYDILNTLDGLNREMILREQIDTSNEPQPLELQLNEFYKLLNGKKNILASIEDGVRVIETALQAMAI